MKARKKRANMTDRSLEKDSDQLKPLVNKFIFRGDTCVLSTSTQILSKLSKLFWTLLFNLGPFVPSQALFVDFLAKDRLPR